MSHIPNSAIPHAGPTAETETPEGSESRFGQLAEKVREYPKTSAAVAGAAMVGLAAAAAIPALRARGRSEAKGSAKKK
jgi:hypothetical protein